MTGSGIREIGREQGAQVRPAQPIGGPFREVQFAEEMKELRQGPGWQAGRNSKTLVKHPDLRIVLTALRAHAYLHEHYAAGSISLQTLEGHLRMHIPGRTFDLKQGDLIVLEQAVPHDVEALTDSAYLLTIAWHEASAERNDGRSAAEQPPLAASERARPAVETARQDQAGGLADNAPGRFAAGGITPA